MARVKWFGCGMVALLLSLTLTSPMAQAARNGSDGRDQYTNADQQKKIWPRQQARQGSAGNGRDDGVSRQRDQRLSPEERLQLRRDIRDAGREIYLPRR